jgi:hypothetical protein
VEFCRLDKKTGVVKNGLFENTNNFHSPNYSTEIKQIISPEITDPYQKKSPLNDFTKIGSNLAAQQPQTLNKQNLPKIMQDFQSIVKINPKVPFEIIDSKK